MRYVACVLAVALLVPAGVLVATAADGGSVGDLTSDGVKVSLPETPHAATANGNIPVYVDDAPEVTVEVSADKVEDGAEVVFYKEDGTTQIAVEVQGADDATANKMASIDLGTYPEFLVGVKGADGGTITWLAAYGCDAPAGSDARSLSALQWLVDDSAPVIAIETDEEPQATLEGVTYYPAGTTVTITVDDPTFDRDKSDVMLNASVPDPKISWTSADDTPWEHVATVELGEGPTTISVSAYDKVKVPYVDGTTNSPVTAKFPEADGTTAAIDSEKITLSLTPTYPQLAEGAETGFYNQAVKVSGAATLEGASGFDLDTEGATVVSGGAGEAKWESQDDGSLAYEETFDGDGTFSITAQVTTKRGQVAKTAAPIEFTVDKTAPVLGLLANGDELTEDESTVVKREDTSFSLKITEANLEMGGASKVAVEVDGSEMSDLEWMPATEPASDGVYTAVLELSEADKTYEVKVTAMDKAGNKAEMSKTVKLVSPPDVKIEFDKEPIQTADEKSYYGEAVTATITASGEAFRNPASDKPDANDVTVECEPALSEGISWTYKGSDGEKPYWQGVVSFNADGSYKLSANVIKQADGWAASASSEFEVDTIAPTLKVEFKSENGPENDPENDGKLVYSESFSANLTVVEKNFDPDKIKVSVKKNNGDFEDKALTWSTDTDDATKHTAKVEFTVEGRYILAVEGTDLVGHALTGAGSTTVSQTGRYASDELILDTAAPTLDVEFSEAAATGVDGDIRYYKEGRTAAITLVEGTVDADYLNSNENKVIKIEGGTLGSWSTDAGDATKHTAAVTFGTDGEYTLKITGVSLAGKVLEAADSDITVDANGIYESDPFVIDKTAPKITFTANQEKTNTFNGVDYYKEDYKEDGLTIEVLVEDTNATTADVVGADGNVVGKTTVDPSDKGAEGVWIDNAGVSRTTVSFEENDSSNTTSSLTVKAYDKAGNFTEYTYGGGVDGAADKFVLDLTAPTITYQGDSQVIPSRDYKTSYENGKYLFYDSVTSLKLQIEDGLGLDAGVSLEYGTPTLVVKNGDLKGTVSVNLVDGAEFTQGTALTVKDLAGNSRTWTLAKTGSVSDANKSSNDNIAIYKDQPNLRPSAIILDTIAPKLTLSNDVAAGTYYNEAKSSRLSVVEQNFRYLTNLSDEAIRITKKAGEAGRAESIVSVPLGDFVAEDKAAGKYYYDLSFASDGHYSLTASVTDPVGRMGSASLGEFTIDRTAPTVSVSFDNNSAVNGTYYPAGRTATIVVTEHNFDASLINVQTNGSMSGWSSDGDTHTATVSFQSDGTYNLSVSGQDLAGNAMSAYASEEFVVDMTTPTITFSEVSEGAAYGGDIAPVIEFSDEANFDPSGVTYTLTGTKNGSVTYNAGESDSATGRIVSYENFQRIASVDDIYTISAQMTDMAGNAFNADITFSVNRFGSNYRIVDAETYTANNGYLLESQDVLIEEINVSGCESETMGVTMTRGASAETLELTDGAQNRGYSISSDTSGESSSNGWALYTYRVAAGNFDADGRYHLAVSSSDNAGNMNTSANYFDRESEEPAVAEVSFILDTTDPIITNLNVADGETYDGSSFEGSFTVVENIGIDKVDVVVDGESIAAEDDGFGNYTFTIPGKAFASRDMTITAYDLAGRTGEESVGGFHVTSNPLEIHLPWIIAAVVLIGGGAFLLVSRKRKGGKGKEAA